MYRGYKIFFGIFFLFLLVLTYLEATEPEPLNLNPSYTGIDKIPLGSFAFFESWKNTRELQEISKPPFEVLSAEEKPNGIYFFLNDYVVFDQNELDKLLSWVEEGNSVFISAGYISKNLLDTLNIAANTQIGDMEFKTRPQLKLKNDSEEIFNFNFDIEALIFTETDSLKHQVLGNAFFEGKTEKKPNFLHTGFGKGSFFLHSTPEAFSNYFLLQENNEEYAEKVLAYLNPEETLLWDNYYKSGKSFHSSPLYYLLSHRELKWAYYFVILASVLFIIFEAKRRQRPIPIITPLKNQSYDYAQTIGHLYLEQKQYKELSLKKIELFLEHIRENYRLSTREFSEDFYQKLAARSGAKESETKELFNKIRQLENQEKISKEEFLELSKSIANYKSTKNGTSGNQS